MSDGSGLRATGARACRAESQSAKGNRRLPSRIPAGEAASQRAERDRSLASGIAACGAESQTAGQNRSLRGGIVDWGTGSQPGEGNRSLRNGEWVGRATPAGAEAGGFAIVLGFCVPLGVSSLGVLGALAFIHALWPAKTTGKPELLPVPPEGGGRAGSLVCFSTSGLLCVSASPRLCVKSERRDTPRGSRDG
jgi:hypothetical protein